jgi:hypothetical protein
LENFSMYRMSTPGTARPSSSSGRRRVVCPLMAAATRETPMAKMAAPQPHGRQSRSAA